ncbi:hypothetical protein TcG_11389 [Trypanosoma cruzi]|uniref:Uncharacterized protein n=2 Tax=Trypanosoma cruzi TaxID=5693 RepID=V5AP83_TRYCR|nr:hypothetical protein TCDM_13786 [Trypanosoma cruzi Dm28c]PBJ78258.1 hypothetical protein BCY84_04945 [Trypanosoma cruzi cruzi]PWU92797.1 hypothetical protein C4B63_35g182 [Trypanosoma cruzi]RNF01744.1 hypothetical protein TcG_11389 [Trypanosoma cruzi]
MVKHNVLSNRPHHRTNSHHRTAHNDRPPRHGQPHAKTRGHAGARSKAPIIVDDGTIPAAFISPFQASQPQAGQHSATVVRTSVSGPSQQQMLFYSSVQRRGGVFTKSEYETKAQLARTGVLPNSIAYRKRARIAMEEKTGKPQTLQGRFADMQSEKVQEDVRQAKTLVLKNTNANRFALEESESDEL